MEKEISHIVAVINDTKTRLDIHLVEKPDSGDAIGLKRWKEHKSQIERKIAHYVKKALNWGCEYDIIEVQVGLNIDGETIYKTMYFTNINIGDAETLVNIIIGKEKLELVTIELKEIKTGIFY